MAHSVTSLLSVGDPGFGVAYAADAETADALMKVQQSCWVDTDEIAEEAIALGVGAQMAKEYMRTLKGV